MRFLLIKSTAPSPATTRGSPCLLFSLSNPTFRSSNPLLDHSVAQLPVLKLWSDSKQQQQSMHSRPSPAAYQTPRGPISFAEGQLPAIDPDPPPASQRRDLHLLCVTVKSTARHTQPQLLVHEIGRTSSSSRCSTDAQSLATFHLTRLQPNLPLKGDALLAAHLDSIAEFANSKFPGNKVYYTVKRAHIKKEPLYLGFDQRWALSKWKASVWRFDKQRHYRSIESYMDSFHKDDTELIFPGNYEAFQTPYSLPQPPNTPWAPFRTLALQDLESA
ncbi:hypothetical protein BFW01_g557 [Lasiodiplodia theobromae]|nr:hypothetical protein BFW01_g557 [Lasiodiplodia theobromae]